MAQPRTIFVGPPKTPKTATPLVTGSGTFGKGKPGVGYAPPAPGVGK